MLEALTWWFTLEILGLAAFPVAFVVLGGLPDRGYTASKALGLLLTGWLAYTLAMMQLAGFGRGLMLLSLFALSAFSFWLTRRRGRQLWNEFGGLFASREFRRLVLVAEVLFAVAFAIWSLVRAYDPDIFGTEKFMDFGFMNAIMKSENFPPNDPWLSGHPINYYYFGYILMAGLSLLSWVVPQVGYNLANVTLFALTALGTFGVAFNLIIGAGARDEATDLDRRQSARTVAIPKRRAKPQVSRPAVGANRGTATVQVRASGTKSAGEVIGTAGTAQSRATLPVDENATPTYEPEGSTTPSLTAVPVRTTRPISLYETEITPLPRGRKALVAHLFAILAALLVVGMGNLTTMFAVHDGDPQVADGWRLCFSCQDSRNFNWFAPSRVIQDYKTSTASEGVSKVRVGNETINEFPAFSFLLGDMHPHVMALPLTLLALSVGLAFARRRVKRPGSWGDGLPGGLLSWTTLVVAAVVAGSLYAANTWDYPTYLVLMLFGLLLPHLTAARRNAGSSRWLAGLRPWVVESALVVVLSFLTYVFFHLTFKSLVGGQAADIPENLAKLPLVGFVLQKVGALLLVNTSDKTITGFLVIFGIFLTALLVWLAFEAASFVVRARSYVGTAAERGFAPVVLTVTLVSIALAFVLRFPLLGLLLPVSVVCGYLISLDPGKIERNFALAAFGLGAAIGLVIEVVYLRDSFGDRMNTLFKFYYQLWVLWGLASAFAIWRVLSSAWGRRHLIVSSRRKGSEMEQPNALARIAGVAWASVFGLLALSGLMYSVNGPLSKIGGNGQFRGLDGTTHLSRSAPNDFDAINWLRANASGEDVVLECCRDEYNNPGHAGRVSSYTGVPTLASWDGHEFQWRGGQPDVMPEIGKRRELVTALYTGTEPGQPDRKLSVQKLVSLLHQYGVTYIFAGDAERGQGFAAGGHPDERLTPAAEELYRRALQVAFSSGSTVVYRVP